VKKCLEMKVCLLKIKILSVLILVLTLILSSCTFLGTRNISVSIDWVDIIMLNDIQYIGNYNNGNELTENSIGDVIGEVEFNVSENIKDSGYKVKNGDAAYLPKGTRIYKLKDYKQEFRIAVNIEKEWRIYEADTNPGAKKGEDLLDIRDKVSSIIISRETDGMTELRAVTDKADMDKMVNTVLNAEVDQSIREQDGERYFISFGLLDGSNVTRCFWIDSGELSRGILLPDEFGIEVKKALAKK
jgi:hypothetical protein